MNLKMLMKNRAAKIYYWQGVNLQGQTIQGELLANNYQAVKQQLAASQILFTKIKLRSSRQQKLTVTDITQFSRELATLINAGVPLANSLTVIKRGAHNSLLKIILADLIKQIESGIQLSAAMKNYSRYFNEMMCNLVDAGEQSGTLDQVLLHIADYQEQQLALKRKIIKSLYYPLTVSLTAFIVTIIMMVAVIPQFANFFANFGAQLPLITRIFIAIATLIRHQGWLIVLLLIVSIISLKSALKKSAPFKQTVLITLLKTPIWGNLQKSIILTRCLHVLALTVNAGLPITTALKITANVVQHPIYKQGVLTIQQYVLAGQALPTAVRLTQLFNERDIEMLAIGEESGTLDNMLTRLAQYYEDQLNYKISQFTQLLEPVVMLVLSAVVGLMVVAMYMPIFRLGSVI